MNMMYELILAQKKASEATVMINKKPKYEYDSDEEIEGGTWEHKKRMAEMNATKGEQSYFICFYYDSLVLFV